MKWEPVGLSRLKVQSEDSIWSLFAGGVGGRGLTGGGTLGGGCEGGGKGGGEYLERETRLPSSVDLVAIAFSDAAMDAALDAALDGTCEGKV